MPGIGLTVVGRVGPLTLYIFGLTVAAGALVGMAVTLMQARRFDLSGAKVFEVSAPALLTGVVGARLAYVMANFSDYRPALTAAMNLAEGGFAFYGGLAGGMVVAALYAPRLQLSFARVLDAAAPGLAIGQAIGFIGVHLAGRESAVPWAVLVDGRMMHPFPAYGIILAYGIFFVVWQLGGRAGRVRPGRLFLVYLLLHGFGTAVVGTWAAGARWSGLTPGQWTGLAVGIIAIVGLVAARRESLRPGDGTGSVRVPSWGAGHKVASVGGSVSRAGDPIASGGGPAAPTIVMSTGPAYAPVRPDPTSGSDIAKVYGLRYTDRPWPWWERFVGPAAWVAGLSLLLILFSARL